MSMSRFAGMGSFLIIWGGQLFSITGSALTSFILGVWVYQQTGSVTQYSMILLASMLPGILVSPVAGVAVDRLNRRTAMLFADLGSAVIVGVVALLFYLEALRIWHLYILLGLSSVLRALHMPAYTAATTLIVPKTQFARAGGLVQMAQAISLIAGPGLAAWLLQVMSFSSLILVDLATFLMAAATLLLVQVPSLPAVPAGARRSILAEAVIGMRFIKGRPGLLGLLGFFMLVNFSLAVVQALITPMVLSFATASALGTVIAIGSTGMLVGSTGMSAWGGPSRKINGVLGFGLLLGVGVMLMGLRPWTSLIAVAFFLSMFSAPFINASSQAIWQIKTPLDMQGRVFSVRMLVAWSCMPLGYLLAGPLADHVFEPLMRGGGPLAETLGRVLGAGPGRGIGLLFVIMGLFPMLTSLGGYLLPRVREVEEELPDQVVAPVAG